MTSEQKIRIPAPTTEWRNDYNSEATESSCSCYQSTVITRGVDPDKKVGGQQNAVLYINVGAYAVRGYQTSKARVIIESNFEGLW